MWPRLSDVAGAAASAVQPAVALTAQPAPATTSGVLRTPLLSKAAWERRARAAFWLAFALVAALGIAVSLRVTTPGHWDAINNLTTARNIAEGRGYVSDFVQQLAVPMPLPGPETVRPPGVPFLMAGLFAIFGQSLVLEVLLSIIVLLAAAFTLRTAIRVAGGGWVGDVAGVVLLLAHNDYEVRSLWNNVFLSLIAALFLLVLVRSEQGRWTGWPLVIGCAALASVAFLMKQTQLLGPVPFVLLLLATDRRWPLRRRLVQGVGFLLLFAALTAPYWLTNLIEHGQALYSPIQGLRLPARYGLLPLDRWHRTLLYGAPAFTYGSVLHTIGARAMLKIELSHWRELAEAILALNPFIVAWAAAGALFIRRRDWRVYALVAALCIPPVFDAMYWVVERRYLWPLLPCLLFMAWLTVRGFRDWRSGGIGPRFALRLRRALGVVIAAALLAALVSFIRSWRWDIIAARAPIPGWISAVLRDVPPGAVVMTAAPPELDWWTRRKSVIAPLGPRRDVLAVAERYDAQYYLDTESNTPEHAVSFAPGDLRLVDRGPGWRLYVISAANPPSATARPRD